MKNDMECILGEFLDRLDKQLESDIANEQAVYQQQYAANAPDVLYYQGRIHALSLTSYKAKCIALNMQLEDTTK